MNYIEKTLIVSVIFSSFLLITLQINRLINKNNFDEHVLGINSENMPLCNLIDSLARKYCGGFIQSSTLPNTNIGPSTVTTKSSNISNVISIPSNDGKSATITWNSNKPFVGKIEYGATAASLVLMSAETLSTTNHRITLSSLRPSTTYYFRIRIGNELFDNGGIPYTFKTK